MARKTPFWRRQRPTTKLKRKIAKATGIPTTRSGRKAKVRRMLLPGCALPLALIAAAVSVAAAVIR